MILVILNILWLGDAETSAQSNLNSADSILLAGEGNMVIGGKYRVTYLKGREPYLLLCELNRRRQSSTMPTCTLIDRLSRPIPILPADTPSPAEFRSRCQSFTRQYEVALVPAVAGLGKNECKLLGSDEFSCTDTGTDWAD